MPSLLANIAGAVLGVGSAVVAVAVPISLTTGGGEKYTGEEVGKVSLQEDENSRHGTSQHSDPEEQEVQQKLEDDDFKKYCYGGFLKQEREGELLVCAKTSEGSFNSKPLFYLQWGEKPDVKYGLVRKVNALMQRNSWKINFELEDSKGNKTLTIPTATQGVLNWLNADSQKELQRYCRLSAKNNEDNYQLECTKRLPITYKKTVTKITQD